MTHRSGALHQPWQLELRRGLKSLRAGQFSDAEAHFERAHRLAPDQPEVCYALGRERLRAGDARGAEPLLRAAWTGAPDLVSAAATLARCLALDLDRKAEADSVLDRALEHNGPIPTLLVVRAELRLDAGDPPGARGAAEQALDACADDEAAASTRAAARAALARAHNAEGLEHARSGHHEQALFAFKQAADTDPGWSAPLVNSGASLLGIGRPRAACQMLERALRRAPDNPLAHLNLGLALRRLGRDEPARRALERTLELDPFCDAAVAALGQVLADLGDIAGAEALVTAFLGEPDDPPGRRP